MSGTASVPNTFQSAVTATGLQLDTNYNTVVAYLNDPTNRNNYAADGGATNTVVVTFAPPVVGGYTAGLELAWKWAATPTGATVLNANGLGNINVVNPDGSALQAGQGTAGSIGKAVYDGTRAIFITPPSPATKAAMQTATASASFETPSMVKHNTGVVKAWAILSGPATGTVITSGGLGVSQHIRNGTGTYSIVFSQPFAAANYAVFGITNSQGNSIVVQGYSTATCTILCVNTTTGDAQDPNNNLHVMFIGELA